MRRRITNHQSVIVLLLLALLLGIIVVVRLCIIHTTDSRTTCAYPPEDSLYATSEKESIRISEPVRKILHPIVKFILSDFVPIYTGANRLSVENDSCDGKLLVNQTIPSENIMGGTGRFDIYLPAGYAKSKKKYPVLYLLHGLGYGPRTWDKKVTETVDSLVRDGTFEPLVVVMPYAQMSFYLDGFTYFDGEPGHKYESFFMKDLKPYIETKFPVLTDREHTFIAGASMGGYGALYYGIKYPHLFCMCYSMSGATEGLDWFGITDEVPSICRLLDGRRTDNLPRLYLECGDEDRICGPSNRIAHKKLTAMGIEHNFRIYKGNHSPRFWRSSLKRLINIMSQVPDSSSAQKPKAKPAITYNLNPTAKRATPKV